MDKAIIVVQLVCVLIVHANAVLFTENTFFEKTLKRVKIQKLSLQCQQGKQSFCRIMTDSGLSSPLFAPFSPLFTWGNIFLVLTLVIGLFCTCAQQFIVTLLRNKKALCSSWLPQHHSFRISSVSPHVGSACLWQCFSCVFAIWIFFKQCLFQQEFFWERWRAELYFKNTCICVN